MFTELDETNLVNQQFLQLGELKEDWVAGLLLNIVYSETDLTLWRCCSWSCGAGAGAGHESRCGCYFLENYLLIKITAFNEWAGTQLTLPIWQYEQEQGSTTSTSRGDSHDKVNIIKQFSPVVGGAWVVVWCVMGDMIIPPPWLAFPQTMYLSRYYSAVKTLEVTL